MNHYKILLSTELLDDRDTSAVLEKLTSRCSSLTKHTDIYLGDSGEQLVSLLKPSQDTEGDNSRPSEEDTWSSLSTDTNIDNIITAKLPATDGETESGHQTLTHRLHLLADSIPKIGVFVDVYWIFKDETLPSMDENIELFGAFKQLLEWNNAHFTFVTLTSDLETSQSEPWVTLLRGHVTSVGDLDLQTNVNLWRGAIQIVGSNLQKPINLPGFELRADIGGKSDGGLEETLSRLKSTEQNSDELSCGVNQEVHLERLLCNKLEVVGQLDRQEVPLLYYTGQHCTLCIQSESKLVDKSRHFIQRLDDNQRLCYLVKLCYGTSWKSVVDDSIYKDKNSREKKTWMDYVQENTDHVAACPIQPQLDGDAGQYILLLCASGREETSTEITCEAHLLRNPGDICGKVAHQMSVESLWSSVFPQKDCEKPHQEAESLLSDLPHFTSSQLTEIYTHIRHTQIYMLQAWIDARVSQNEAMEISRVELVSLLSRAQQLVLKDVRGSESLYHQLPSLEVETDTSAPTNPPRHDYEKLVLTFLYETETKFARHRSNESLAGLSPPPRGKVVTLNAKEFLKYFENDGSAAEGCATDLALKKSNLGKRLRKCSVNEAKSILWPESESLQYHDIYYNHCIMEEIEAKSKRLLSRFLTTETSSTCIYRQSHSPSILTISTDTHGQAKNEGQENKGKSPTRVKRSPGHPKRSPRQKRSPGKQPSKRQSSDDLKNSKKLYAAKKALAESKQNAKKQEPPKPVDKKAQLEAAALKDAKLAERISRAQRHKRKLEEVVKDTLKGQGIQKDNPLFKPCALRLYNTTKSFVKDLTSSVGLRQAMLDIAESNVKMVIDFETRNVKSKS